jgi:DNA-binding NarL/FixJ family response regulator
MVAVSPAKIVIADQQPVVCAGLTSWLAECPDLDVVAVAPSLTAVDDALARTRPHILVTDLQLQGDITLPKFSHWLKRWPELLIMVYSMSDERLFARRCLSAGARGYVMKSHDRDTLLAALRELQAHQTYLSPSLRNNVIEHLFKYGPRSTQVGELTERQYLILSLIAEGRSRSEIAQLLGLSVKTIDAHKTNIRERLGLESSQALVQYAMRYRA